METLERYMAADFTGKSPFFTFSSEHAHIENNGIYVVILLPPSVPLLTCFLSFFVGDKGPLSFRYHCCAVIGGFRNTPALADH